MTNYEKIIEIIENNSSQVAAEEILRLFNASNISVEKDGNYFCTQCGNLLDR
jgi:hypothetical protein